MPKIKTCKTAKKRLRRTGAGKSVISKTAVSHFSRRKSKRTKQLAASTLTNTNKIANKFKVVGL